MVSLADDLDLAADFPVEALIAMREQGKKLDAGYDFCSFEDYVAFLEEVRPSRAQLLDVKVFDRVFTLDEE